MRGSKTTATHGDHPRIRGEHRNIKKTPCGCRDHPRIRGEHSDLLPSGWLTRGSSPHTRGALCSCASALPYPGIIPAYAGSTPSSASAVAARWDHPRIRGEHHTHMVVHNRFQGSSPHTRGAQYGIYKTIAAEGIIPAYAGSTNIITVDGLWGLDHPRIRGEHTR